MREMRITAKSEGGEKWSCFCAGKTRMWNFEKWK